MTEVTSYFIVVSFNYGQGEGVGIIWKGIWDIPTYSQGKPQKVKLNKAYLLALVFLLDARIYREQNENARRAAGVKGREA